MPMLDEENFPRGGSVKKLTKEPKPPAQNEPDLFKERTDNEDEKRKGRKRKLDTKPASKKVKKTKMKGTVIKSVLDKPEKLTVKNISPGMLILGCVKEVHEYELILGLPNNISGKVPITNISDTYHEQLQKLAASTSDSVGEDVHDLHSLFKVGMLLPCKIVNITQTKGDRREIKLSINPKDVNQVLSSTDLRNGMAIYGSIQSQEDHGYVVDTGVKGIRSFLKNKDAERYIQLHNDGYSLRIGQTVLCMVETNKDRMERLMGETRVLNVTIDPKKVSSAEITKEMKMTFRGLVPGMKFSATVEKVTEDGVKVKFLTYTGIIHRSHLERQSSKLDKKMTIQASVLYIHPTTKVVALSNLKHIVENDGVPHLERFDDLDIGDILEDIPILRVDQRTGLIVKLKDTVRGHVSVKNLSDKKVEDVKKDFKRGSDLSKCRIIGFDYMDNLAIVTLKQTILSQQFLSLKDVHPGCIVKCEIASLHDKGVAVKVTNHIKGFVSNLHLADVPLKHPEKKFAVGKKLKCRVLTVDTQKRRLQLTHKKTLVSSKYPVLTSFSQIKQGFITEGFIADVKDSGCLVIFYNNVKGWVPRNELSTQHIPFPEKVFYKGQVVKCRVKHWKEAEQRITLSFKLEKMSAFGTKTADLPEDFKIGKMVDCKVEEKNENGLDVELIPSMKKAFLPKVQLSDSGEMCDLLLNMYQKGTTLKNCMYLNKTNIIILTRRESFLKFSKEDEILTQPDQLQPGMMLPGTVKNLMNYGVFVELPAGLTGLVPNRFATDRKLGNMQEVYAAGQPVVVKVTEIDAEKGRFLGTLRMTDCYHGETDIGLDLLSSYLMNQQKVVKSLKDKKGGKSPLREITVGSLCKVVVKSSVDEGVICQLENSTVKGFATEEHMEGVEVTEGDLVDAVVLCVDFKTKCLELSLSIDLIKTVKRKKMTHTSLAKPGQTMKADVIQVKPDYILVSLRGHTIGQLGYLPAKRHLNDVLEVHQFCVGQRHPVVIKRVEDGNILCSLFIHEKRKVMEEQADNVGSDQSVAKMSITKMKSDIKLEVGALVPARVRRIHPQQMELTIGHTNGRIHISETLDDIKNGTNPFAKYKQFMDILVRIIGFRDAKTYNYLPISHGRKRSIPECSIKPSKMKADYEVPDDENEREYAVGDRIIAFVQHYKNHFLWMHVSARKRGIVYILNLSDRMEDLENPEKHFLSGQGYNATVIKVQDGNMELSLTGRQETVEEGKCTKGWIVGIKKQTGLIVRLANDHKGVVRLTDLADEYIDNPLSRFTVGQFIKCYVCSVKKDTDEKCVLSMRKSRLGKGKGKVKNPEIKGISQVESGQVLQGYVVRCNKSGLLVSIGCDICGIVSKKEISDYAIGDLGDVFYVGKLVTAKVISVNTESSKVHLSLRESDTGVPEEIPTEKKTQKAEESAANASGATKVTNKRKRTKSVDKENSEAEIKKVKLSNKKENNKITEQEDRDSGVDGVTDDDDSDIMQPKLTISGDSVPRLNVSLGFSWDTDFQAPDLDTGEDIDSDDDSDSDSQKKLKKKSKEEIRREIQEDEKRLYELERQQLEGEVIPQTADDFDRLILQSPDSSLVWLRYMAFHLETTEIDKSRIVAERALKTISFREEQEKLNVWVAYLNLENMYGTPELLKKVLDRAVQQNDPLKVYQQMINIYAKSGKAEEAENLYNVMVKKHSANKDVWIGFGQYYFKNGKAELARKLMQRCLKCLEKRNHVETIAKFAQMEFKFGEPERGKTMFENILSNYPKRTDLWSVYIDMVTKLEDKEATRQLFERVIHLKLSAKKMKFFFKKYLDFEKNNGNESTVKEVKQKALEYVESKGYTDD